MAYSSALQRHVAVIGMERGPGQAVILGKSRSRDFPNKGPINWACAMGHPHHIVAR